MIRFAESGLHRFCFEQRKKGVSRCPRDGEPAEYGSRCFPGDRRAEGRRLHSGTPSPRQWEHWAMGAFSWEPGAAAMGRDSQATLGAEDHPLSLKGVTGEAGDDRCWVRLFVPLQE